MDIVYPLTPAERLLSTILNGGVKVEAGNERNLRRALDTTLAALSPRQAHVLQLRFGLDTQGHSQTLQAIADALHLPRERVRQIEQEALRTLRSSDCLNPLKHHCDLARVRAGQRELSGNPQQVWRSVRP